MNAALLDLQYLPNISWFARFTQYEHIWIEKHENFVKSTGRNRCEVAGANGRQTLTIPLLGGRDHHQKYTETKMAYSSNWKDSHWHSIKSAYGSAPYFEFYAHIFQKFYEKEHVFLYDFNLELLNSVLSMLKLSKGYEFTTEYQKEPIDKANLRSTRNTTIVIQSLPRYYQVFEERNGFISNLSILDLIFHLGPESKEYLLKAH